LKERIEFIESNIRDLESTIHIICVKNRFEGINKTDGYCNASQGMTNIFNEIGESDQRTEIKSETQINPVLDPEGWYSQNEVRRYLNPSINHNIQKGMISKAVVSGKIKTNGEKGKIVESRVHPQ
jgi:transcriptional regulator with AAA-type ATPase domain